MTTDANTESRAERVARLKAELYQAGYAVLYGVDLSEVEYAFEQAEREPPQGEELMELWEGAVIRAEHLVDSWVGCTEVDPVEEEIEEAGYSLYGLD